MLYYKPLHFAHVIPIGFRAIGDGIHAIAPLHGLEIHLRLRKIR